MFKNRNFFLLFQGALTGALAATLYSFAISFYILDITGNNASIQGVYLFVCGVAPKTVFPDFGQGLSPFASLIGGVLLMKFSTGGLFFFCACGLFLASAAVCLSKKVSEL